jgi:hypothetical protein
LGRHAEPKRHHDSACDNLGGANLPSFNKSLTQLWTDHIAATRAARAHQRHPRGHNPARRAQPAPTQRSAGRLLAQPFQHHAWDYSYASATCALHRDVIRPTPGNFRTMLGGGGQKPGWLFYLDNYTNQVAI